jgi:hypothetical protein
MYLYVCTYTHVCAPCLKTATKEIVQVLKKQKAPGLLERNRGGGEQKLIFFFFCLSVWDIQPQRGNEQQ